MLRQDNAEHCPYRHYRALVSIRGIQPPVSLISSCSDISVYSRPFAVKKSRGLSLSIHNPERPHPTR